MELTEIKAIADKTAAAFDALKTANEANEKKRDVLLEEKMSAIQKEMDGFAEAKANLEKAAARTQKGGRSEEESKEDAEYKTAFNMYVRKGKEDGLIGTKAMSVGSDTDGGFTVTPAMSAQITKFIYESDPMRQLASVQTISTDSLEIMQDLDSLNTGWVSETGNRAETDTPSLGKKTIAVHELYAQPKATQKLLDDSNVNIEQWLAAKVSEKFARVEDAAFINGTGTGQPRGILTQPEGSAWGEIGRVNSGVANNFNADSLVQIMYALKEYYATGATWIMNRQMIKNIRLLKDANGVYIYQAGLGAGQDDSLLGKPIKQSISMPTTLANGSNIMAFGNFREAYQIVDRLGIRTLRDPFTEKPFVKFYTTKRVGGDVVNYDAYKILKTGV